jgi:hypothetical protein
LVAGAALVWKFPKDSMEPLVTLTLLLFGFAAMLARYGPSSHRLEAWTFATVGLIGLAVAFGPWTSGPLNLVPAGRLCEPIAQWLYPSEDAGMLFNRRNQIQPDVYLAVVLGAWALAVGSARVARCLRAPVWSSVSPVPRGEPCPS